MTPLLRALPLLFFGLAGRAQTPVTGVINHYAAVNFAGPDYAVAPGAAPAFAVNDTVLLIQMKGAAIDTSNTAFFGSVAAYNGAGTFEYLIIQCRRSDTLFFTSPVVHAYAVAGAVQVVRVPHYADAVVQDSVVAAPWNGTTGGVLALTVADTLTLAGTIQASGRGFRGGTVSNNPNGYCGTGYSDYYYGLTGGSGAEKGEGIGTPPPGKDGGRGAPANGGGGGNKHNSGGGGGSNFSAGGAGGNTMSYCAPTAVGGVGGHALSGAGRAFMGGGGGCADYNNAVGTFGGAGGGIVVVHAGTLIGGGDSILANGGSVGYIYNGIGDGAGGGGGGGSVLLQVGSYGGSPLVVQAHGGHGGDQNTYYPADFGPGGGGGVGVIKFNGPSLPAPMVASTEPGASGLIIGPATSAYYMLPYGAADGDAADGRQSGLSLSFPADGGWTPLTIEDSALSCREVRLVASGGPAGGGYRWVFGDGTPGSTAASVVHTFTGAGPYEVILVSTTGGACADTARATISLLKSNAIVASADTAVCPGQPATLRVEGGVGYSWSPATGTNGARTDSATVVPLVRTVYTVVGTDTAGCTGTDTVVVELLPRPPVAAVSSGDLITCAVQAVQVFATGARTYRWQPARWCSDSTSDAPFVSPPHSAVFYVEGTDEQGCVGWDTLAVESQKEVVIFMPDAFTPNGDSRNDAIYPIMHCNCTFASFKVFNRWGQLVFSTVRYKDGWDGMFDGRLQDLGVYHYIVTCNRPAGNTELAVQTGSFTLVH